MADQKNSTAGKSLQWLSEIEYEDLLTGDTRLIYDYCGREVLLALLEHLPSMSLYVSTKPLEAAKRRYISQYFDGANAKLLAARLHVSESQVYKVIEADHAKRKSTHEG